jgi:hypothetical protein
MNSKLTAENSDFLEPIEGDPWPLEDEDDEENDLFDDEEDEPDDYELSPRDRADYIGDMRFHELRGEGRI